jgi:hypothetical protein
MTIILRHFKVFIDSLINIFKIINTVELRSV